MLATIDRYLQLRRWSWSRIVRMLLGIFFVVAGIDSGEVLVAVAGGGLAISALLRIGCNDGCDAHTPPHR
jgi:hypothetical protein